MNESEQKKGESSVTHSTQIGSVTGQVHTGSGDINIKSFSVGDISNRGDFVKALQQLMDEIETARHNGLDEKTINDALSEIKVAEQEARKEVPAASRVLKQLQQARAILVASAGAVTAATTTAVAVNRLLPLLEKAIHAAGQIF